MSRSLCVRLASLVPLALPLAAQEDAAARLVPADAVMLVRLESIESWNALARAFEPLAGDGSLAGHDLAARIAEAYDATAAEQGELDRTRPVYLAASFAPGEFPAQTVVLPIVGATPIALDPTVFPGAQPGVVLGGWCAVSTRPGHAAAAEPSPLVARLDPGVVAVHVDLATLIAAFRPLIDMGLDQFEMMIDQMAQADASPMDVEALMEAYLDVAHELVGSARALDLALARDGNELAFVGGLTAGDAAEEAPAAADLTALAGRLAPEGAVQMVYTGRWSDMLTTFQDFVAAVVSAYPEPLRTDMEHVFELSREVGPLLEPGLAMDFAFGAGGMRGLYLLRSSRPDEVLELMERSVRLFDHEGGMMRIGAAEEREVAGTRVRVLPFELRFDWMTEMSALPAGSEEARELEEVMAAVYGREPRLALGKQGDLVVMGIGGDDALLAEALATLARPAAVPPRLARTLARLPAGVPGFAYCLDMGRLTADVMKIVSTFEPLAPALPSIPATIETWGWHRGATWTFGAAVDVAEVIAFGQAMKALEEDR